MSDAALEDKFALLQSQIEGGRNWFISDITTNKPGYFTSVYLSEYIAKDLRSAAKLTQLEPLVEVTQPKGRAHLCTLYVSHAITAEQIESLAVTLERISGLRKHAHAEEKLMSGRARTQHAEYISLPRR